MGLNWQVLRSPEQDRNERWNEWLSLLLLPSPSCPHPVSPSQEPTHHECLCLFLSGRRSGKEESRGSSRAKGFQGSRACVKLTRKLCQLCQLCPDLRCAQVVPKFVANRWPNVTWRPHWCLLAWVNFTVTLQAATRETEHNIEGPFLYFSPGPGGYAVSRFMTIKPKIKSLAPKAIEMDMCVCVCVYTYLCIIIFLFSGDLLKCRKKSLIF